MIPTHSRTCTLAFAVTTLAPAPASGRQVCITEEVELFAPDGQSEFFGRSLALSGDRLLVGEFGDDSNGTESGAAFVFTRTGSGWASEAELLPADGQAFDRFGFYVALDGDTALVGAYKDDDLGNHSGSAYVFVRSGGSWIQQAKLLASDGTIGDSFGRAVGLRGDTAWIGARDDDDGGQGSGSAYVFERAGTSWTQTAKIVASDASPNANFGHSLSFDGSRALVGATGDEHAGPLTGSAYVFARSGAAWVEEAKLVASDAEDFSFFGNDVALSGGRALVGAFSAGGGKAYVYEREGLDWTETARLQPLRGSANNSFGDSVALEGTVALIGDSNDSDGGTFAGAAYLYAWDGLGWRLQAKLLPGDADEFDHFGATAALRGGMAIVAAERPGGGSVYSFAVPPPVGRGECGCPAGPCGNDDPAAGCTNSLGDGARLGAYGRTLPDELSLVVRGASPKQPALFLAGDDPASTPFGDGLRCIGSALMFPAAPFTIAPDGTLGFGHCFGDPLVSALSGAAPGSGETKRYQLLYRDPNGPCGSGFNLSNALAITW